MTLVSLPVTLCTFIQRAKSTMYNTPTIEKRFSTAESLKSIECHPFDIAKNQYTIDIDFKPFYLIDDFVAFLTKSGFFITEMFSEGFNNGVAPSCTRDFGVTLFVNHLRTEHGADFRVDIYSFNENRVKITANQTDMSVEFFKEY